VLLYFTKSGLRNYGDFTWILGFRDWINTSGQQHLGSAIARFLVGILVAHEADYRSLKSTQFQCPYGLAFEMEG